ncbi:hypothetical protein BJ912DRAFT_953884, partial [Pholiota molesta]
MLFKFTAPDMLNTSLVDVATGERAYNIVTVLSHPRHPLRTWPPNSPLIASSSERTTFLKKSAPAPNPADHITDAAGKVVANITWTGRRPNITIGDENIGLLLIFSALRLPKILAIPTRFDTEYVWTATADSLTVCSFHQNTIRIPSSSKVSKPKLSSPSKFRLSSPSTNFLSSTSTKSTFPAISEDSENEPKVPEPTKSTFIPTRLPGDIEIILSFLMMEILRRGDFRLPLTPLKSRNLAFKEAEIYSC